MKKNLKKIIGFTLGISALSIVTPIALASCTSNSATVDENVTPKQIIDFNKYQKIVYKSNKDDSTTDPYAPIYNGQELYQFQYDLTKNNLDDSTIEKVKKAFSLEEDSINANRETATSTKKYYVNRSFRSKNLINQLLSNLDFTLQTNIQGSNEDKTLKTSEIMLDTVSNQNLESIIYVAEVTKSNTTRRNITWHVYPKKDKEWDVKNETSKNAYFSINFVPPKS